MLTELSIRDFAIIDEVSITFHEGLTVLTGETGAGKSIIIDAVQLLAGGRGSVDFVRHGSKKAEIEGLFIIDRNDHAVYETGERFGIKMEDHQIVLHRTITNGGKSICRVNGKLVTLTILREIGNTLIDIHSQHETQSLLDSDHHIHLLDLYDERAIAQAKADYEQIYNELSKLKQRYKELSENEQEMAQRLDLLQFQHRELEEANLSPDEDEKLEKERDYLMNYERIFNALNESYTALYGEQKGLEWLNIAQQSLQDVRSYDGFIAQQAEQLTNHYYAIEDIVFEMRNYMDTLAYNPNRLNEIEARLDEINGLKRKYGTTVNEILEYTTVIRQEIEEISNKDSHLEKLSTSIQKIEKDAFFHANILHKLRRQAADSLTAAVHKELKDLYMENTMFSISFDPKIDEKDTHFYKNQSIHLHKNGFDHIQFMISTNPGEPMKELNKVASGGELSRMMLVLKKIFAKYQGVTSVIFDEVDTGVSGRVAQAMGEKIYEISKDSQVLCITHLPQVAAMADTHQLIGKHKKDNRMHTNVYELSTVEQVDELSRMITGTKMTATAKEHARELLQLASDFKQKKLKKK
ncbi:MAG TPA: DNA repair protein RecN [Bacillota bacterium]